MARPLHEIAELVCTYNCPVLYAGDIFDRWNTGPEVINFALANLPYGWAIPGQHDLPNHNYDDIKKSSYWTLIKAGMLEYLHPGCPSSVGGLLVWGYPWGFDLKPVHPGSGGIQIALCHRFIYTKDTGYPGAPAEATVRAQIANLKGYNVAVFGDNHKGFITKSKNGLVICNCGGLMRRKTDERDYKPGVGLLHGDGSVTRHYLDTSQDKFLEITLNEDAIEHLIDMTEFVGGLKSLGSGDALDFTEAAKRFLDTNGIVGRVREIILNAVVGNCG